MNTFMNNLSPSLYIHTYTNCLHLCRVQDPVAVHGAELTEEIKQTPDQIQIQIQSDV